MSVIIYGKSNCPHTAKARQVYPDAEYIDVVMDPSKCEEMLAKNNGVRKVPTIIKGGEITVGFEGGS